MCTDKQSAEPESREQLPRCLCTAAYRLDPEMVFRPELKYSKAREQYLLICPNCRFFAGPFDNIPAVRSMWATLNRSDDPHMVELWIESYGAQHGDLPPRRDPAPDSGSPAGHEAQIAA